jgi:glycosyltransferase involved in cell wall biosynthesis
VDISEFDQIGKEKIPHTLIVDLSDNFGGANARVLELMKNMPVKSIGLATLRGSLIASELEQAGYQVHRVADNKFDPRIPLRIAKIIRSHGYQIVDTQNPQSKLWGSVAALMSGASLISTLNSWYMNEHPKFSLRWFVYSGIELITNIALSRYIVVSREILNAMLKIGIPESKIDLIYNAINIKAFEFSPNNRKQWLEKYQLPADAILCVAAGRLSWAKGHDTLAQAFELLRTDNQIYCLIAGEGELRSKLEEKIERAGLTKRLILLGHLSRPDVLSLIDASDVFVMPSRTEGTPIALLEAAALKKPILASRVGGIPELVSDGSECLLIPPDNALELARGIQRLIHEDGLAESLVENAYRKVVKDYTLDTQVRSTIRSYNKALQVNIS